MGRPLLTDFSSTAYVYSFDPYGTATLTTTSGATLRTQISELVRQLQDGAGPLVVNQQVRYPFGRRPV